MSNPFALLGEPDSDDEDQPQKTTPFATKSNSAPKKTSNGPSKVPANNNRQAAPNNDGGDYQPDRDSRGRANGKGGRNNRSRGRGDGRGRGAPSRSQGKAGNKPDDKKGGHGTGNWGAKDDEIVDGATVGNDVVSPEPEDNAEAEEEEPEEVQLSLDDYLNQKKSVGKKLNIRKAGEGEDKPAYKQGSSVAPKKADEGAYGGDKYGNYKATSASKKKNNERTGRAATTERLLVDVKYAPSEQAESSFAASDRGNRGGRGGGGRGRGGEGRGRGGEGRGRGAGRGRGEGRGRGGRGRGDGRGRNNSRGGGGRGDGRRSNGKDQAFSLDDFPTL